MAALTLLALISSGCARKDVAVAPCPAGDRMRGAAPPKGQELWCEKIVDGKPVKDGPFIVYGDNGRKMIQGTYRDGVQEGEWTMWYQSGQQSAVDHYHDGQQNGLHVSWFANGQKALKGNYRDGKREGAWTRWDPSGLTSKQQIYKDDRVVK